MNQDLTTALEAASFEALETLRNTLSSSDTMARVAAATAILDRALYSAPILGEVLTSCTCDVGICEMCGKDVRLKLADD